MKATEQLQLDVVDELAYAPDVDSSRIAVTAQEDGVVTLKGTVSTYMQYLAAQTAAKRIRGVKGIANDLDVQPAALDYGDTGIAEIALRSLKASASVPRDSVKLSVSKGWVTLEGKVEWEYQRRAAYNVVSDLFGVKGVTNKITIVPRVKAQDIRTRIEGAFKRNAQIDAGHVQVETSGNTVTLSGTVRSLSEREAAESAAWAGGASIVNNRLAIKAHA